MGGEQKRRSECPGGGPTASVVTWGDALHELTSVFLTETPTTLTQQSPRPHSLLALIEFPNVQLWVCVPVGV